MDQSFTGQPVIVKTYDYVTIESDKTDKEANN
jgi:hypothetical protein